MLIAMRKGAAGWVAKILFGLLILSFAAWGVGDYLTPEIDPVIADVGDIEIRRTTLDLAERRQVEQMRRLLGQIFDPSSLPENALRQSALQQLIGQAALEMEARELGVAVSDAAIGEAIRSNPQFLTGGVFDPDAFRRALFGAGLSEEAFVRTLRVDLARAQVGAAVAAALPPPLPIAEALFAAERQQRDASFVRLETDSIEPPAPTDEDLKTYVAANAGRYAEPERRDARAIVISAESVADAIDISEAELSNRYEDAKAHYKQPERRDIVQALFRSEDEARAFLRGAPTTKSDFVEAAETAGAAVTELGEVGRGELFLAPVADAAFAAAAGSIPAPIQSALGWHVLLIADVLPERTLTLDEVRDDLVAAIRQEGGSDGVTDAANAVEDALASGQDIAAASRAAGLPIVELNAVDRGGADRDGTRHPGLPADPAFLQALFERAIGDQSGLIELRGGAFVALIVDKTYASEPKPFDAVRADAAQDWKADKRVELARARLDVMTTATSRDAFKQAAEAIGVPVTDTGLQGRTAMAETEALTSAAVAQIFAAKPGATVRIDDSGAVIAAFVAAVQNPNFDPNGAEEKAFLQELADARANDRIDLFAAIARAAHPADIRNNAMQRLEDIAAQQNAAY